MRCHYTSRARNSYTQAHTHMQMHVHTILHACIHTHILFFVICLCYRSNMFFFNLYLLVLQVKYDKSKSIFKQQNDIIKTLQTLDIGPKQHKRQLQNSLKVRYMYLIPHAYTLKDIHTHTHTY